MKGEKKEIRMVKQKFVSVFVGDKKDKREIVKSTKSFLFRKG
jgi:hypothetical protein